MSSASYFNLSEEQTIALNKFHLGNNIFITGPGGTGKTELIRRIYDNSKLLGKKIQVCATTGTAAVLLQCNAKTIYSWAGIGIGDKDVDYYYNQIKCYKKNIFSAWKTIQVLIIDEVSMLPINVFELLDNLGKLLRKSNLPFGGVQLVFSGDFYQLPPVPNKEYPELSKFCFESNLWSTIFTLDNHIELKTIFRQNDSQYIKILNQIREGALTRKTINFLENHVNSNRNFVGDIKPTKLFPLKRQVDNINNTEMNNLPDEAREYHPQIIIPDFVLTKTIQDIQKNRINRHNNSDEIKHINLSNKNEFQTYTIDEVKLELNTLSNYANTNDSIILKKGAQVMCTVNITNDDNEIILCNGSRGVIIDFTKPNEFSDKPLPIVKYKNGLTRTMEYWSWESDTIKGAKLLQIPLTLAWALTIHKSQGVTLDFAEIDVGSNIFECGQTYVALSRVKSLDGLYLTAFDYTKIKVSKAAKNFYKLKEPRFL